MLGWLRKENGSTRAGLMGAVVVRNALVREAKAGDGLRLTAPVKRMGLRRMAGGKLEKTFELDALGLFVWEGIDGKKTVEACIRRFALEKRVNLREAEVAVLAFLKMLAKRGLVGMLAAREQDGRAGRRR